MKSFLLNLLILFLTATLEKLVGDSSVSDLFDEASGSDVETMDG